MNFLKNILAAFIGIMIFFGCLMLLFIGIAAVASTATAPKVVVKKNSILKIHLEEPLKDYGGKFEVAEFNYTYQENNGLHDLLRAIEHAKTDDRITAISIESKNTQAGLSQIKSLRTQLEDFKNAGKKVFAYADHFSQKDYYLSSVADRIYINPMAQIEFKGLATEVLFFKDLQEKTGVKMEVIRHGKYKSAVEPFLSETMSEANREQITALITSLWANMCNDMAADRNLDPEALNNIANDLKGRTAKLALQHQLVDAIGYYDQYTEALYTAAGINTTEARKKTNALTLEEYASSIGGKLFGGYLKDKIAVIYAQGDIRYDDGDEHTIGPKTMIKALKRARENKKVKAIVFRINSPGGSALASELIWREVARTKAIKPVIVSMGDLAASGGYYIACNADHIIAQPNTITGSIGVFGVLPNLKGLMDTIGVNAEQVGTNKQSMGYSPFEPLSEDHKDIITENIEMIYDTFVSHVAEGRKMSYAQVDRLAQGRVWTGSDALRNGLVDELGGLDLALNRAAEKAGITQYQIQNYPVYQQDVEELLSTLGGVPLGHSKASLLKEVLGPKNYERLQEAKALSQQEGIQARIPYTIDIQ